MQQEKGRLSPEVLRELARFAGIEFSAERLERVAPRVERYMDGINTINEVDVSAVEPATIFPGSAGAKDE